MKHSIFIAVLAATAMSCGHTESPLEHDHDHGHGAEGHASGEIEMDEEAVEMFGIESEVINPGDFAQVLVVSGEVVTAPQSSAVVSASQSGIVKYAAGMQPGRELAKGEQVATIDATAVAGGDAQASAKAALEAAKRNLDRLEPLYAERIVSQRDYEAAKAEYEQALAAYSPKASGRATAPIKGMISQILVPEGQYVEAGTPLVSLTGNIELTLRADVPERYHAMMPQFVTANVKLSSSDDVISLADLGGKRMSSPADATSRRGYLPAYFTFVNDGSVVPGAMATVYLIGATRPDVLTVPLSAISEQQGLHFVYENVDGDCFRKLPVTLGANDGERVEVVGGLTPGTDIVVSGVAAVRLAETSAVAPEGHSHNH